MNLREIKELIKIVDASGLSEVSIESGEIKLTLKKENTIHMTAGSNIMDEYLLKERMSAMHGTLVSGAANTTAAQPQETVAAAVVQEENLHLVKSPIVGIFYGAPGPEAQPFVKAGDIVKQGQVLCIVEAMKMMNEITADTDGEIVEVLVQNQGAVEFGQPLFKIRKA